MILVYYWVSNNRRFGVVGLLILTYIFMSLTSLGFEVFPELYGGEAIAFQPMAYLSASFVIIFWGFIGFRDQSFKSIQIERVFLYRLLENFLLIGGCLAIIFFLPFALMAFTEDISSYRIDISAFGNPLADYGIINSIFSLFANLFILAQICSFINLIPNNGKRNTNKAYLMLISSLSFVVYVLAYAGRDGVIYWLMSYLFCFLLFRNFILKNDLRKLKYIFALAIAILMIPFLIISKSRFAEMPGGTAVWIINYAGQQLRNFNNHYQIEFPLQYGQHSFPIFYDFLKLVGLDSGLGFDKDYFFSFFLSEGVAPWVFTTFIGNFMYDFGKIYTVLFLCVFSLVTRNLLRKVTKTGVLEFSNLLIFILLYQMVYWGVFYFRLYVANYYILFVILLSIGFKVARSPKFSLLFNTRRQS